MYLWWCLHCWLWCRCTCTRRPTFWWATTGIRRGGNWPAGMISPLSNWPSTMSWRRSSGKRDWWFSIGWDVDSLFVCSLRSLRCGSARESIRSSWPTSKHAPQTEWNTSNQICKSHLKRRAFECSGYLQPIQLLHEVHWQAGISSGQGGRCVGWNHWSYRPFFILVFRKWIENKNQHTLRSIEAEEKKW